MKAHATIAKPMRGRSSFIKLLWFGTILINLFVIAIVAVVIERGRERVVVEAKTQTENYAKIIEENLTGFISKIDITLLTVVEEVSRETAHGGIKADVLEAFIRQQDSHIPEALGLRVVDAQGIIRYAVNDIKVRNASIADRPQFIHLRNNPDAGLVISKPVLGRAAQKWMITLGRRINNPDGSFAGDVHVAVAVDHFINMFSKIKLGSKGNIGLWDKTSLIARFAVDDPHGASVGAKTPSPQLRTLIDSGQSGAFYQAESGIDRISRVYCFRQVNNYPLYLVVGLADEDYLATWRSDSRNIAGLAILLTISTLVSAILISRSWQRREADRETQHRLEAEHTARLESAKREAEEARLESELILTSAGEGICGVDLDGKIVFINPAARRMFGWGENEGIGLELHALTHHHRADGNPYPQSDCPIQQTLSSGSSQTIKEDLYWRTDGTSFPVEFTVTAMKQNGRITGAVNVFRDITASKQAEASLRELNDTLEQRVREETAKNMEKERLLIQQSRLAAMGEMIGNIAHQWRQPINALTLLLSNIKDAYEYNELNREYLNKEVKLGQELIQRMSGTIDDFRNFFKPNKKKQRFSIEDSVDEAFKLVSESFRNNDIEFDFASRGISCDVIGYPNEFAQVILNALSNAKDALVEKKRRGKVRIQIATADQTATITICDNGGGIPEDILPKVFDPYFTTKEKGTGIGLYMSKMIMGNMGGDISIRNVEGGAEVLLTLPLASSTTG